MIFSGQITADACCVTARRCTSPDCYGNCRRVKSVCKCILNSKVFSIFLTNYSLKVKLMKLGSLWIYVAALTPSSWNNPCCPPPYPTPIPPAPFNPSKLSPPPCKNMQAPLFPGEYRSMPWHLLLAIPWLLFLIWQLDEAVFSPRNIRAMCKSVKSLAAVKHNEQLLNSPFFLSGSINKDSFLSLGANSCKTGKDNG